MALLLLACVGSSAVTLAGALLLLPPASRAAPEVQATLPVVRAERFELVDANGALRATLATNLRTPWLETDRPIPVTALQLFDAQGTSRANVGVGGEGPDSATVFTLNDAAGTPRVSIHTLSNGGQIVIAPGVAPNSAELRSSLGMPETLPGDDVATITMKAFGPPFPEAGFTARVGGQVIWHAP